MFQRECLWCVTEPKRSTNQALQAHSSKGKGRGKWSTDKGKGSRKTHSKNFEETQSKTRESSGQHKNGMKSWKNEGKKFDKRKVKFFNCNKYGNFASKFTHKQKEGRNKAGDEANLALSIYIMGEL